MIVLFENSPQCFLYSQLFLHFPLLPLPNLIYLLNGLRHVSVDKAEDGEFEEERDAQGDVVRLDDDDVLGEVQTVDADEDA